MTEELWKRKRIYVLVCVQLILGISLNRRIEKYKKPFFMLHFKIESKIHLLILFCQTDCD